MNKSKPPMIQFIEAKLKQYGIDSAQFENAEVHNNHAILSWTGMDFVNRCCRLRIDLPAGIRGR